jgi:hypothetical protein
LPHEKSYPNYNEEEKEGSKRAGVTGEKRKKAG